MSPIVQNIVIPKKNRFSEKRPDHNWKYRGKHYSLYYQPQPAMYNPVDIIIVIEELNKILPKMIMIGTKVHPM